MKYWIGAMLLLAVAMPTLAAEPTPLERALIGRKIVVPFDVPVSEYGVDFDGDHGLQRNDASRIDRLDTWGMSLRGGETATITGVRVSKRRIEILLDNGGLSTTDLMKLQDPRFGVGGTITRSEDSGPHSTHAETRQAQRDRMMIDDELGGRAESRARDAQIDRAVADTTGRRLAQITPTGEYAYFPGRGSRLRILYKGEVPAEMLDPRNLMVALSEHVMFVREDTDAPQAEPGRDADKVSK